MGFSRRNTRTDADDSADRLVGTEGAVRRDRFHCRTGYFTDSGVIGSKEFVGRLYAVFKGHFSAKHKKEGKAISGLKGIYSLKRLYGEG